MKRKITMLYDSMELFEDIELDPKKNSLLYQVLLSPLRV